MVETQAKGIYEFGAYRINATARTLWHDNVELELSALQFDLLLVLMRCRERVLDKWELIKAIWKEESADRDKNNLDNIISELRRVLGDKQHEYIKTFRKSAQQTETGYQFVAEVCEIGVPVSIAVLPFIPMDAKEDGDESLWRGTDDAIITRINRIRSVVVRPQSATSESIGPIKSKSKPRLVGKRAHSGKLNMEARTDEVENRFRQGDRDPLLLGHQLVVDYVLDCRIRRANNLVRVHANIVSVRQGKSIWKELFDEDEANIFSLEDSIAAQTIATLKLKPTDEERERMIKHHTASREAYHNYKLGRDLRNLFTAQGLVAAMEYFKQAIAADENYSKAYNGVADCLMWQGIYNIASPQDSFGEAKIWAAKALELDDSLAGAHTVRAFTLFLYDWDFQGAATEFKLAMEKSPNYAMAYLGYALLLAAGEQADEALNNIIPKALLIDPHSGIINVGRAIILYTARQHQKALEQSLAVINGMAPYYDPAFYCLSLVYQQISKYAEAIETTQKALALSNRNPLNLSVMGHAYALMGAKDQARQVIDELMELRRQERYISPLHLSLIHAALGEHEHALQLLDEALEMRDQWLVLWRIDPRFDELRENRALVEKLRRVGNLPPNGSSANAESDL